MSKIRKLYYFDKRSVKELIELLNNRDNYVDYFMFNPLIPFHHLLPLKYKFLPETYVLKEKKVIKGLITVAPTKCPLKKMEIQKLFFEENCYEDAYELIQYVVSKYKAMGTTSIIVKVDSYMPELLKLLVTKCDFTQISYEKLWKLPKINKIKTKKKIFRTFRNSDSSTLATLYNESLLPHIRMLLSKDAKEFQDILFKGLSYFNEYKYVIEDKRTKNILCAISIQTSDDKNFILDIIQSSWTEIDINMIIDFARYQVRKRKKDFTLYLKTKKYTQLGEKYEQFCMENNFECSQNQIVLTNSSARIIKTEATERKFIGLNQFCGNRIAGY